MTVATSDLAFSQSMWGALKSVQKDLGGESAIELKYTENMWNVPDAAAAMLGFERCIGFEGEAAIWLESLASETDRPEALPGFAGLDGIALLACLARRISERNHDPRSMDSGDRAALALGFHRALAGNIVGEAATLTRRFGLDEVVLSGGVFQNRILLEAVIAGLEQRGLVAVTGERVPANDGGISVGQAAAGILAARGKRRFQCA